MSENRPFPPSPRRVALAHRAGLSPASSMVVGAAAWIAFLVALLALGGSIIATIEPSIAAAMRGDATAMTPGEVVDAAVALALPLAVAAALAAVVAHVAQTRTLWFPRRRVAGAPVREPMRARDAMIEVVRAIVIGGVAFGWLWLMAPRLAALFAVDDLTGALGALGASMLAALAIAFVATAAFDAIVRRIDHDRSLAMTHAEKREDERVSAMDPRWRRERARAAKGGRPVDAVAGSSVVILGEVDGALVAAAIAWDPIRRPVPVRTIAGRGVRATQILALARRHGIAVHREPVLAARLAAARIVDEVVWPRLAEIIAAIR